MRGYYIFQSLLVADKLLERDVQRLGLPVIKHLLCHDHLNMGILLGKVPCLRVGQSIHSSEFLRTLAIYYLRIAYHSGPHWVRDRQAGLRVTQLSDVSGLAHQVIVAFSLQFILGANLQQAC